ncbi:FUSC family protein [Streptomyces sp. NRRL B-24484]|uniref:FUSC family protein n=1 Tax=Streptomyces sp. NRRL B-24484 TaxID=1463833 RepID=UPI0005B7896D
MSHVFELRPAGLNRPRAVVFPDVALVPLIVLWAIGYEQYLLSALFGLLFAMPEDPGGSYGRRAGHIALFAAIGAGLTAPAFGPGGAAWGWLAPAAFAVTLVAGLMAAFGARRFVNATLLSIWFIGALSLVVGCHHAAHTHHQPHLGPGGFPGGRDLTHGSWMPIAAMIAMKPGLEQTTLTAAQRLLGAAIGAVAAALTLLIPTGEHGLRLFAVDRGLEVVALVLFMHGAAIRFWNHAFYCAAIAAGVLILVDLLQPSDYAAGGYRVLWTACGVGIGVLVMLLAGLLAKRTAKAPPHPA